MEKQISVKSWDDVRKSLENDSNKNFCDSVSQICANLKGDNKDYVYQVKLQFGERIIEKGSRFLFENEGYILQHNPAYSPRNIKDFANELNYASDPLGMVLKNHIEIYTTNNCSNRERKIDTYIKGSFNSKKEEEYNVPLNIIKKGDLFGVFGAIDFISKNTSIQTGNDLHWYAVAGNSTFILDFPFFHSKAPILDEKILSIFKQHSLIDTNGKKNSYYSGKEQVDFVKEFLPKDFSVELIYFPKHYLEIDNSELKKDFHYQLLLKGWAQSSPLRSQIFENKILADVLKTTSLNNDKQFILKLYAYLLDFSKGKSFTLYPLNHISDTHYLSDVIKNFKNSNNYFNRSNSYEPIIYLYDNNIEKNFSLLSVRNLPILKDYHFTKHFEIIKDLKTVSRAFNLVGKAAYELSNLLTIEGYGYPGSNHKSGLTDREHLQEKILKELGFNENNAGSVSKKQILLSCGQFEDALLLKKNNVS